MKYYFFNSNFAYLVENFNQVIGVWDDSDSFLLYDLLVKHENDYIIEESLYLHYKQFFEIKPYKIIKSFDSTKYQMSNDELFFLSNDTIARMFKNILMEPSYFNKNNILISKLKKENEILEINKMGKNYFVLEDRPDLTNYKKIILGNDWGPVEKRVIDIFDKNEKYSLCLQESVIDFSNNSERMKYCDIPMIQGINTLFSLSRSFYILTGNPRYENLSSCAQNDDYPAIINSNFTYGVSENYKEIWLGDIIDCLNDLRINYKIARHPRDTSMGKYDEDIIESNASIIHDILRKSSVLITRFSSLIHEALIIGRPVIYYNLMNENFGYDFEFNNGIIYHAQNKAELKDALCAIFSSTFPINENLRLNSYLRNHVGQDFIKPSQKIMNFLSIFAREHDIVLSRKKSLAKKFKNYLVYQKLRIA